MLQPGDLLIDGGNEWFPNSIRRGSELLPRGILYMGMGVSGGEDGARHGPSLMPGGPREAYELVKDILELIAAKVGFIFFASTCFTSISNMLLCTHPLGL